MDEEIKGRMKAVELLVAAGYNAEVVDGGILLAKKNSEPISREEFIRVMRLLKGNNLVGYLSNPDPCWIIKNPAGKALDIRGHLLVFSGKDAVDRFVENCCSHNFILFVHKMSWAELIDGFAKNHEIAILDYPGEGDYNYIPLLKIPESEGRA